MMMTDDRKSPWYRPTPSWLLFGLLAAEGFLMLSERFEWFAFGKHKGWPVLICLGVVGGVLALALLCLLACVLFRRRFQFTIRSLLVLTFAVAVACSWLAVEMQQARRQRELVEWFHQRLGDRVCLLYVLPSNMPLAPVPPARPGWLEGLLGEDFVADVVYASFCCGPAVSGGPNNPPVPLGDAEFMRLRQFTRLRELNLSATGITDADLKHLAGLRRLEDLRLYDNPRITGSGLACLAQMHSLKMLGLSFTSIGDAGLGCLPEIPSLRSLELMRTPITDAGLERLSTLRGLENLDILETRVTEEGADWLRRELHSCVVWQGWGGDRGDTPLTLIVSKERFGGGGGATQASRAVAAAAKPGTPRDDKDSPLRPSQLPFGAVGVFGDKLLLSEDAEPCSLDSSVAGWHLADPARGTIAPLWSPIGLKAASAKGEGQETPFRPRRLAMACGVGAALGIRR